LNILISGADGFIGKNLRAQLESEAEHCIFLSTRETSTHELQKALDVVDGIIHLAGVNRPKDKSEFYLSNSSFTKEIIDYLILRERSPFIIYTSSTHVELDTDYGRSKYQAEQHLLFYASNMAANVAILRLPNVFGKWSKPNYNGVVATFCYNIQRGLPIHVSDPENVISLLYIDDAVRLIKEAMDSRNILYPEISPTYKITLGELVKKIESYRHQDKTPSVPEKESILDKYLFATYCSFKDTTHLSYSQVKHQTPNSSFAELLKEESFGQVSINVIDPGQTRGNHWHQTKHERFIVIKGSAVIRLRKKYSSEVTEYAVNDKEVTVVEIPPGFVHNIENVGKEQLYTIMWANEMYDSNHPDTYPEEV
jgi:UDP-2-acetamido-2,6-beta-L-arabino-hexul-4-ose reductase